MTTVDKQTVVHLLIDGQVQGVGYRYSTQQQASLLNLCGCIELSPPKAVELTSFVIER